MSLQTNVFPIENLEALNAAYRLYRLRGLSKEQDEYYQNRQALISTLSYKMRQPVEVIEMGEGPHLVLPDSAPEPESPIGLVRTTVYLDRLPETLELDFTQRKPQTDQICIRFLNFWLQSNLYRDQRLWQLGSGKPLYEVEPAETTRDIGRYEGFSVRAVVTSDGGLGLCVDFTSKFVATHPLPHKMTREHFRSVSGGHFVYHYGRKWYEVVLQSLGDLTVSEHMISGRSLLEFIIEECGTPVPAEVTQVPAEATFARYYNNRSEERAAPTGLCYRIYDNQHAEVRRSQQKTTPLPQVRWEHIGHYVSTYLGQLNIGGTRLRVSDKPVRIRQAAFRVPDYEFGKGKVLSVRGTAGAQDVGMDRLGGKRLSLLQNKEAGFYVRRPLAKQFLFLPKTVHSSWGSAFIADLQKTMEEFYGADSEDRIAPRAKAYDPEVVVYNDLTKRTFAEQGQAILKAAQERGIGGGHALVMIHHTDDQKIREEDRLAAMVTREFKKRFDIIAAVNHSKVGQECYREVREEGNGHSRYTAVEEQGRLTGYLRNVAINKILLTNERWPFVLHTPLHADLVIGLDVKNNTAGFTLVSKHGHEIRTVVSESSQREKLGKKQVIKVLTELIKEETGRSGGPIVRVVIHRDGSAYASELHGAEEAMERLRKEGVVSADASLSVVEIWKTSPAFLRMFDVTDYPSERSRIWNPQIGTHLAYGECEGYVCTTGREFPHHRGTVRPLHVRKVAGSMAIAECLEDVYYLSALTWTRPEDCSRYPITTKLTDRWLWDEAAGYDADAIEFFDEEDTTEVLA